MPTDSRQRSIFLAAVVAALVVVGVLVAVFYFTSCDHSTSNMVVRSLPNSHYPMPDTTGMTDMSAASSRLIPDHPTGPDRETPKNFVLVIGDGMGLGQISTASTLLYGPGGGLALEQAEVLGLARLWSLNSLIVDSASSGTAIATGFRTNKKMVGMLPDGHRVQSLLEAAREQSMATAVITTSYLMDATPACFTAHVANRNNYSEILMQMIDSGTDILIGGSSKIPIDGGGASEMAAVVSRISDPSQHGYTLVRDEEELVAATGKILGLFPSRNGDPSYHGPALKLSTHKMLDQLGEHPKGFAAVIESEITDAAGHNNDIEALVEGIRELDAATRVVLDFAEERGDTLVLILADHATGVPAIVGGTVGSANADIRWVSEQHTAHWLPIFAFGPGAEAFSGTFDAAQIGPTIASLMGFEGYPAVIPEP